MRGASSICSISCQAFLKIVYIRESWNTLQTHANIHNVYMEGKEYWAFAKVRCNIHREGDVKLVVMGE